MVILLLCENDEHGVRQAFRLADRRPVTGDQPSPPGIVLGGGF
jgi:hypothetical protein